MYIFLYTIQLLSIKGEGIHTHISSVRELIISNLFRKQYFTINAGHCIYEAFCKSFVCFCFSQNHREHLRLTKRGFCYFTINEHCKFL